MRVESRLTGTALTNLAIAGLSAGAGLFVARMLGPEDRGIFAVAFSWYGLALALGELGTGAGMTYLVAREPADRSAILRSGRQVYWVLGILSGLLLALISWALMRPSLEYLPALLAFAMFTPVGFQMGIPSYALQSVDIGLWNRARLAQPLLYFAGAILVELSVGLTLTRVVAVYFMASVLTLGASYFWLSRVPDGASWMSKESGSSANESGAEDLGVLGKGTPPLRSYRQSIVNYGLRNFWSSVPNAASSKLDILVMGVFLLPATIGEYAVAATLAGLAMPAASAYANLVLPRLAAIERTADVGRLRSQAGRAMAGSALFAFAVSLVVAGAAPLATEWVLGPDFPHAASIALVLCLAQPGRALNLVGRNVLRGLNAPGRASMPEWGLFVVLGASLLSLVPAFGVWGAAFSVVISAYFGAMLYLWVIRRTLDKRETKTT